MIFNAEVFMDLFEKGVQLTAGMGCLLGFEPNEMVVFFKYVFTAEIVEVFAEGTDQ